jgi:hypothetical protein
MTTAQCNFDQVIIFPYVESGYPIKPNIQTFVETMLGISKVKDITGKWTKHRNPNHAIFRSDRCFINDDGSPNRDLADLQKDIETADLSEAKREKLFDQKTLHMKEAMQKEYKEFNNGSDEPLIPSQFCELVCTSVAKRLQQACGLTTTMKYGVDGKGKKTSILMGIKADAQDLRTEADRANYKVQIHNKPFSEGSSHCKSPSARVTFNEQFQKENPEAFQKCKATVRDRCEDSSDPSVDPGLFTETNWQPMLRQGLQKAGHPAAEECNGWTSSRNHTFGGGVYMAPYTDYRIDDHFQPLFRHYLLSGEDGEFTEFREVDRIRLVNLIIGRHLSVLSLKSKRLIVDSFALHNLQVKEDLLIDCTIHRLYYS